MIAWRKLRDQIAPISNPKLVLDKLHLLEEFRKFRSALRKLQDLWRVCRYPNGDYVEASNHAVVFVDYRNPNYRWYYGSNLFLEQEHRAFTELLALKKPNVIIDIGAHWGIFPAMLDADHKRFPSISHVICIEPDPRNIPILRKTVSRIKNFKVTIVESAIGDSNSTISAFRDGGTCLQTYSICREKGDLCVEVRKLETILEESGVKSNDVSHIKIDIDGFEPSFFFGNCDWLDRFRPLILTEYWYKGLKNHPKHSVNDYYKMLQNGYKVILCEYPAGTYSDLGSDDIGKINQLTSDSVANILLIPK